MCRFKYIIYLIVFIGFSRANAGSYDDFFKWALLDQTQSMSALLKRGFDPNSVNEQGQTGLLFALQNESYAVAELLAAQPQTDVNLANTLGETPLMLAAIKGQLALCRQLIARGAQVNKAGWTPLHYAASAPEADTRVIALLLANGAAVNAESDNKTTPLMMAAGYGTHDAVSLLLKSGADPRRRNAMGFTAAQFAEKSGRDDLAERLASAAK
jgi:ankyrin repeat protein